MQSIRVALVVSCFITMDFRNSGSITTSESLELDSMDISDISSNILLELLTESVGSTSPTPTSLGSTSLSPVSSSQEQEVQKVLNINAMGKENRIKKSH